MIAYKKFLLCMVAVLGVAGTCRAGSEKKAELEVTLPLASENIVLTPQQAYDLVQAMEELTNRYVAIRAVMGDDRGCVAPCGSNPCQDAQLLSNILACIRVIKAQLEQLSSQIENIDCGSLDVQLSLLEVDIFVSTTLLLSAIDNAESNILTEIITAETAIITNNNQNTDIILSQNEVCCSSLTNLIENSTTSIIDVVNSTTTFIINNSTVSIIDSFNSLGDVILSQNEACCAELTSLVELGGVSVSVIDAIGSIGDTIISQNEVCCSSLTNLIENSTTSIIDIVNSTTAFIINNSTVSIIDSFNSLGDIILSQDEACCANLSSQLNSVEVSLLNDINTCCGALTTLIENAESAIIINDNANAATIISDLNTCCTNLTSLDNRIEMILRGELC